MILFLPSDSDRPVDGALAVGRREHGAALQRLARDIAGELDIGRRIGGIGLAGRGQVQPGDFAFSHRSRSLLTVSDRSGAVLAPCALAQR